MLKLEVLKKDKMVVFWLWQTSNDKIL